MKKIVLPLVMLGFLITGCIHAGKQNASAESPSQTQKDQIKSQKTNSKSVPRKKIDINALISKAKKEGKSYLRISPGDYDIDNTINLHEIKDLVIDGTGAKLFMTKIKHTFFISNCDKITIKGFTIDYDPIPFTQATITSFDGDRNFKFTIHDGYPDLTLKSLYNCFYVFDRKTRLWKKGISDVYGKMKIIDPRHGSFKSHDPQPLMEVGDLVCIDPRRSSCIFICNGTKNLHMESLTIYTAPGATIGGRFCGPNHSFKNIKLTRGPRPKGATEDRLLSTNADGINYAISTSSPKVETCEFGFMGDDAINFHGPVFPVLKVESPTSFLTVRVQELRPYKDIMTPGEKLRHLDAGTYAKLGTVKFKSIVKVEKDVLSSKIIQKFLPRHLKRLYNKCTVYRIQLEKPLDLKIGQNLDFPAASCSGFVIKNSYFHDNRPRGLRLMSSNGVIENNRFERIRDSAIDIGNEYPDWGEAGWVENVVIKNNVLTDIGTGKVLRTDNRVPGAICLFTMNSEGITKYFPGHSNILIENNTIKNCAPSAIYVYGAKDVTIQNNTIENSWAPDSTKAGSQRKTSPKKAIDIHPDSKAILKNNKVTP